MSNFSRGLLAATLTGSLALAGTTVASANDCGTPSAEFTATVDGKEHTFKKVTEFLWQATDDEDVTLSRADIFQLANEEEDVCSSEPIDLGDWGSGDNDSGSESDEREDDDTDSEDDGDDAGSDKDEKPSDDKDDNKDKKEQPSDDKDGNKDKKEQPSDDKDGNKDKKSSIEGALSSEDGKPSGLGIAAIVISVLGALAAAAPHAARALGIKLPF